MKKIKLILCMNLILGLFLAQTSAETEEFHNETPSNTETPELAISLPPEFTVEPTPEIIIEEKMDNISSELPGATFTKQTNDPSLANNYELAHLNWDVEDTNLTAKSANEMIQSQMNNQISRAAAPLRRSKRVASYQGPLGEEYVSLYLLNNRPAWCIEPYVTVILDGNGNGPIYDSTQLTDLSRDQITNIGRVIFYGYGHPLSGNSDAYALATQLLIWQIVAPSEYNEITQTLKWCTPADQSCAVQGGSVDVSNEMNVIKNLVDNYDQTPSFADDWHGTNSYSLNWNETLRLTDSKGVFDWFNDYSEESHKGINIKKDGNDLLIDIDNLYYEGNNTPNGKTLTFKRKDAEYEEFITGILLWISGSNQKLIAASYKDPSPRFTLSFKLNTADIDIRKLDDYYQFGNSTEGTQFIVGWYEDPETQYLAEGGQDSNWTYLHNWSKPKVDDLTGQFNFQYGEKKYYPLMTEDGTAVRKFTIGADGILHINGLLPSNKKWWIKEVNASNPYMIDMRVFSSTTGNPGSTTTIDFANSLRDVTLEVVKEDAEDQFKKINGATYAIFEIAGKNGNLDLDKNPSLTGIEAGLNREKPTLTYKQLEDNTEKLSIGESFFFNGYVYTIVSEGDTSYVVNARKVDLFNNAQTISRTQLPTNLKIRDKIEIIETLKPHGTNDTTDDTIHKRQFEVITIDTERVVLKETNTDVNVSFSSESTPNIESLPDNLKVGDHFEVGGIGYTIKQVLADQVIANPDTMISVDLNNLKPDYFEIPNVRNLKLDDTFTLGTGSLETKYKVTSIADPGKKITLEAEGTIFKTITLETLPAGSIVGDTVTLLGEDWTIDSIQTENVTLSKVDEQTIVVNAPQWIAYEDVPATVADIASLTVKDIKNPIYTVKEKTSGIEYIISDNSINQINEDGSHTLITDGTVPGYLDIIQGTTSNNGGSCEEPYNIKGCPVGTVRTFSYTKNESHDYIGPQFDELEAILGHPTEDLSTNDVFAHTGINYTVTMPVDTAEVIKSISIKWNDGIEHNITLEQGTTVTNYIDVVTISKDYEIVKATDKEILLTWNDAVIGKNTMSNQKDFKIRPYTDMSTLTNLTYDNVPAVANLFPNQTFVYSGQTYKVLFNDEINRYLVIQDSELNWYEVTPTQTTYYSPMSYDQYIDQELTSDAAYIKGDTLQSTFTRRTVLGDDFSIDGHDFTITEMARADIRMKVIFGWKANSPFSWSEIQKLINPANEIISDGVTYKLTSGHGTVCSYQLENVATKEKYPYCEYTLVNDNNEIPYEEVEPVYNLEIYKPGEITYADFLEAYPLFDAIEGDTFTVGSNTYEVIVLDTGKVTVKNTATKKSFVLLENDDKSFYETMVIWFVEKGSVIDLNNIFTAPKEHEVTYSIDMKTAKAELVDNLLTATDISRFTVTMTDTQSGVILEQKEFVITNTNNGKGQITKVDGLPMFLGDTGKQYIHLVDPNNHNMPLPFYSIDLFSDEDLKTKIGTFKSNLLGTIDVSHLGEGTYYYVNPLESGLEKKVIVNPSQMEGQLKVDSLKWGRTYLACEYKLPDGYDYQDEVCHTFVMDLATDMNISNNVLTNKLRRLGLQVVKVDQNERETLLNGAWFTVRDVTKSNTVIDINEQSTAKNKLLLSDVPDGSKIGDTFLIWRDKQNGKRTQYTIKSIRDEEIVIENAEGKQFWIPTKGTNEPAPLLFTDIQKLVPKMEVGDTFTTTEKEPRENLKSYVVKALTEEETTDVFGNPIKKFVSATVVDAADNNQMPILLKSISSADTYPADQLGKYVSGAIFIERTHQVRNELITWSEILEQVPLTNLVIGKKINVQIKSIATIPSFDEVKGLTPGTKYDKEMSMWNIDSINDFKATLSLNGTVVNIDASTLQGVVETVTTESYEVVDLTIDGNGNKVAVTLESPDKNSTLYVHKDALETFSLQGLPGIQVKISDKKDMSLTLANGYTNLNGQLLVDTLIDGTYFVRVGTEEVVEMKVSKGTIFVPEVKYGTQVEVCETKSPLGYLVGNACEVVIPVAEYTQTNVKNFRTNKKIVWWEEGGKRIRKMGN